MGIIKLLDEEISGIMTLDDDSFPDGIASELDETIADKYVFSQDAFAKS